MDHKETIEKLERLKKEITETKDERKIVELQEKMVNLMV